MLASFSSQHLESHLHDPGNPLYDSITKNDALVMLMTLLVSLTDAIASPFRTTAHVAVGGDRLTKMV